MKANGQALLATGLLLAVLAGCGQRPSNLSVTDRATIAACRSHADQVYDRMNRGAIYNSTSTDAPNSSIGLIGDPTGMLSDRYARDRMIERCVGGTGPTGGAAVAPSFSVNSSGPGR